MYWIACSYIALIASLACVLIRPHTIRRSGYVIAVWASSAAMLVGGAIAMFSTAEPHRVALQLSILPSLEFTLDALRGFFLIIAAVVYASCIAFVRTESAGYSVGSERSLLGLTVLLCAATFAVILSANVLSLVFTWELMSLSLWALISFDVRHPGSVHAGLFTLALSEAGSLAALAGLMILATAAGSYNLADIAAAAPQMPAGAVWAGFLLTFFGFGVKTGILPVNVWMADAYEAAPRALTPIFSGATMNLGVFTLLIVDGPLANHNIGLGLVILVTGAVTAILGIVYALTERDMTRLLARSSIENLGIVVTALGAGLTFAALDKPIPAGMALIAGLYHMMNHSSFKTLLFLGAGGIHRATGTNDMDRLGGLMRRLPLFGSVFLVGAIAIAALPPFNGYVSEWLTLESLLRIDEVTSVPVRIAFGLSGAALALTAGLALTCFTLLAGTSLLGIARSPQAERPAKVPRSITIPMIALGIICFLLGVLATAIIPELARLVTPLAGANSGPALVPAFFGSAPNLPAAVFSDLSDIGARLGAGWIPLRGLVVLHSGGEHTSVIFAMSTALSALVIVGVLILVWLFARIMKRNRKVYRKTLWDAGLPRLRPEMTYNATGFASSVRVTFNSLLRPVVTERIETHGAFSTSRVRSTQLVHIVDRLTTEPLVRQTHRIAEWVAGMHHGRITAYAGYVLYALVGALLVAAALLY